MTIEKKQNETNRRHKDQRRVAKRLVQNARLGVGERRTPVIGTFENPENYLKVGHVLLISLRLYFLLIYFFF